MNSSKPSASERLRRGSPVTQPSAANQPPASGRARVKPYRLTIDLTPADHDLLRDWSHRERISQSDAVRALIHLVSSDETVAQQVRDYADQHSRNAVNP